MTCDECLYFDFCKDTSGKTDYFDEDDVVYPDAEYYCSYAKDKRRLVELPCRVGDEVFELVNKKIRKRTVEKFEIGIDGYLSIVFGTTISANVRQIGKTVFLTREAAERALKEATKNEQR